MTSLTHEEIQDLLGAYALDAVEGEEREAVELHLRECPRCRAEVAEHREVAALIAHGGAPAPAGVWDRIVAELEDAPPPRMRLEVGEHGGTVVPIEQATSAPRRRWASVRVAVIGAAAAIIVVLGIAVVRLDHRLGDMDDRSTTQQVATAAMTDPTSRRGTLELHDGTVAVPTAITREGAGFLFAEETPALDPGIVYQLWGAHDGDMISLGTFEGGAEVVSFHVTPGVTGLAVTEEEAPGVPTPQHDVIGQLEI